MEVAYTKSPIHKLEIFTLSIICFLFFVLIYEQTLLWLYERYTLAESYYSHGFLIPLIAGYLIYRKKESITNIPISYSYLGMIIVLISLFIHWLSVIIHVYFISGFSILFFTFGVSLFLFGAHRTKIISTPLLYLIFMFPLPLLVIQKISLPLKAFVTKTSVALTNLIGIQSVQTGFLIGLPDGALAIGNPCSGLRSIFSFLALGAVFLIVDGQISVKRKVLFFLICIPIALISNILRVVFLIITGNLIGTENVLEGSFYHDFSGYAVFVIGLIIMSVIWKIFK